MRSGVEDTRRIQASSGSSFVGSYALNVLRSVLFTDVAIISSRVSGSRNKT